MLAPGTSDCQTGQILQLPIIQVNDWKKLFQNSE